MDRGTVQLTSSSFITVDTTLGPAGSLILRMTTSINGSAIIQHLSPAQTHNLIECLMWGWREIMEGNTARGSEER